MRSHFANEGGHSGGVFAVRFRRPHSPPARPLYPLPFALAEGSGDWTNADDDPKGAAKPVAEKQWSCVEWMGDYAADETKFFLDGVEHPSLATTLTTKHGGNPDKPFYLPEFSAIWFGWAEYQPTTQQFELWFDEIAIDPERIGCVL